MTKGRKKWMLSRVRTLVLNGIPYHHPNIHTTITPDCDENLDRYTSNINMKKLWEAVKDKEIMSEENLLALALKMGTKMLYHMDDRCFAPIAEYIFPFQSSLQDVFDLITNGELA